MWDSIMIKKSTYNVEKDDFEKYLEAQIQLSRNVAAEYRYELKGWIYHLMADRIQKILDEYTGYYKT